MIRLSPQDFRGHFHGTQGSQQGAILIVALLILLLLSLAADRSLNTIVLEERIISALFDQQTSFENAESGLAYCEREVVVSSPRNSNDFLNFGDAQNAWGQEWWRNEDSWRSNEAHGYGAGIANATSFTSFSEGEGRVASDPTCIREYLAWVPDCKDPECLQPGRGAEVWLLTSRGEGATSASISIVQSTLYARH